MDIIREVFRHQMQATVLVLYSAYIAISASFLFVPQTFTQQNVPNIVGYLQGLNQTSCKTLQYGCQMATQYHPFYLELLLGILLIFMVYPSGLLLIARSRSTDEGVREAFTVLPVAWVAIGLDLLFFNGYLLNEGVDASAIGYLVAAAAFAATAATFRRATLLSAFFQPTASVSVPLVTPASTFSGQLGLQASDVFGKAYLLQEDPSVKYEESIKAFALELGTMQPQHLLFSFTSRGSPVYNSISGLDSVRFFTLTTKVSYPKPGELPTEVLVPSHDQSQLLNILNKAITTNPKSGLVFDGITDLILSSGLETTYKFLKQAIEMTSSLSITSIFLITAGAHNEREDSIVRSLFSNQLSYKSGHLSVDKMG